MNSSNHFLLLGKSLSNLELIEEQKPIVRSSHTITITKKKNKPESLWFFKKYCKEERPLAEYETYIGEIYRIILGDKAPKIRIVYNESGEIAGSISKKLPGFIPLSKTILNINQLINDGLSEILFASYFNAEDDLHKGNFGSNGKIDHDMSAWPITSHFKGKRPILGHTLLPNPHDAFSITKRDIKNFPNVQDIRPFYWPTNFLFASNWALEVAYSSAEKHTFSQLAYNPDFEQNKYYTALKIILIPPKTFENIGLASLTHKSRQLEINQFYLTRQSTLYKTLLKLKEFRLFVQKNPSLFKKILDEFSIYNDSLRKKQSLFLDLTTAKKDFYLLWIKCHEYHMVESLCYFQLLNLDQAKSTPHKQLQFCYQQIISLTHQFITLKQPNNKNIIQYCKQIHHLILSLSTDDLSKEEKKQWRKISYEIGNSLQSLYSITLTIDPTDKLKHSLFTQAHHVPHLNKTITTSDINHLIHSLAQSLLKWLENNKNRSSILLAISQATSQYAPPSSSDSSWLNWSYYLDYRHYTRTRIAEVKSYANKILQLDNSRELTQLTLDILNTGEWKPTSFNKILIRQLYNAFSEDYLIHSPLQQLQENMLLFNFYECIDLGLINIENHFQQIHQEMLLQLTQPKPQLTCEY